MNAHIDEPRPARLQRVMPRADGNTYRWMLVIALSTWVTLATRIHADEQDLAPATKPLGTTTPEVKSPERVEARCSDGSILKLNLLNTKVPLKTDYGTLEIPGKDIQRIEFATRIPPAIGERIKAAVASLGDSDYKAREAASAELQALAGVAYPALLEAAESKDLEVVLRAEQLIDRIRKAVPEEDLQTQEYDVIYTAKSQFGGTIELESLKVDTALFGQQQLPLSMLRRLGSGDDMEPEPTNVLPDPGNLVNFQGQVGKTLYFRVAAPPVDVRQGFVWGSDIYTYDSALSLAAVHAGVLKPGESKVVGVTMLGPQNSFAGSLRNGIPSANFGQYPAAYKFVTRKSPGGAIRTRR